MKAKQKDYTRLAIWLLVAYQVFFTTLVLISIHSLWVAVLNINQEERINMIKRELESKIYLVIQRYANGKWGVASCWNLPLASTIKSRAVEYKNVIIYEATSHYPKIWKKKDFAVLKVDLSNISQLFNSLQLNAGVRLER